MKIYEVEVIESISYMYGCSFQEAEASLQNGEYTRNEVLRAIAWNRADGLAPYESKKKWAFGIGIAQVTKQYGDKI